MSEAEAVSASWTIQRVLVWAADDLRARGSSSPRLDAEVLLSHVLGVGRVQLVIDATRPLQRDELARYRALHVRRRAGEPVAYLVGAREFYGRPFRVDARVLVPRPDTEALVDVALERSRHLSLSARVLDLCTGSGCVAITLGRERPTTQVLGSDVSEGALAVACDNALRLGALNVGFVRADVFDGVPGGPFDLVTANPPYIAEGEIAGLDVDIRAYEPALALSGGADGLAVTRRIVSGAPARLAAGGILAVEVAAGQAQEVAGLFAAAGLTDVRVKRDYGGHERVVSGVRGR